MEVKKDHDLLDKNWALILSLLIIAHLQEKYHVHLLFLKPIQVKMSDFSQQASENFPDLFTLLISLQLLMHCYLSSLWYEDLIF